MKPAIGFAHILRVVVACIACSASAAQTPKPAPKPSLASPNAAMALPAASAASSSAPQPMSGWLVVNVDGLEPKELNNDAFLSNPQDFKKAADGAVSVSFDQPLPISPVDQQRQWVLPFHATGMPSAVTLSRFVTFKLGAASWTLPYQLTAPAAPALTWSLKGVPPNGRLFDAKQGVPISIAVSGSGRLTGLSVVRADLIEVSTRRSVTSEDWSLACAGTTCSLADPGVGSGVTAFWIKPSDSFTLSPGKYDSVFTLTANGKAEGGETVTTTLYYSSACFKWAGFGAILLGIGSSMYFATFLRRWVDINRLLLPAAQLKQQLDHASSALSGLKLPVPTPEIDKGFRLHQSALFIRRLELNGLPTRIPVPWGAVVGADPQQLKTYLDAEKVGVEALVSIVNDGCVPLAGLAEEHANLTPPQQVGYEKAIRALDQLADLVPTPAPADLLVRIRAIVDAFKAVIAGRAPNLAGAGGAPQAVVVPSPQTLEIRIRKASVLGWSFVCFTTLALGTYLLVWLNPGFGTCSDIAACFFWGLGLPSGAALAGLTTNSVLTTFNIVR